MTREAGQAAPTPRPRAQRRARPAPVYTVQDSPTKPDPKAAKALIDWLSERIR